MSFDQTSIRTRASLPARDIDLSYPDLLRGGLSAPEPVDISELKTIAALQHGELYLRLILLGAGALTFLIARNDAIPLLIYGVHLVGTLIVRTYIASRAVRVARRVYLAIALGDLFNVASYASGILYFGTSFDASLTILAFMMFAGFYMHTLGERSRLPTMLANDIAIQVCVLAVQIIWIVLSYRSGLHPELLDRANSTIMVFGGLGLHAYFLLLCANIRRARQKLAVTQERRVADERLMAIGQLSGGIAHDFNNMLTAVLGNLELAQLSRNPAEAEECIRDAERAARSGAELTAQLLAYARRAHLRPELVSLGQALDACSPRLRECLHGRQSLRVVIDEPSRLAVVTLDQGQFCGVLASVLENASDAMADGGVVTITAGLVSAPERGVFFEVKDNGEGIAPEILPLVFEPYFTTKPKGHGTGLGLAMARGIVEQSGGRMKLASELGRGTTVSIFLPTSRPKSR